MPPRQKVAAPIDRPLSRAYLREFSGWSTAYPPGLSDPTSLRLMENVQINRDGSARVRPGLRYLSYATPPTFEEDGTLISPGNASFVGFAGSFEPFFMNDGSKAYLCAVRIGNGEVGFQVLTDTGLGLVMHELENAAIGFVVEPDYATLRFTEGTTYVKFLQIDNKIFALSNNGEPMRVFYVGNEKRAKVLQSIERPNWDVADKLEVVHPEAAWITAATPTGQRCNLSKYGSMEASRDYVLNHGYWYSSMERSTDHVQDGTYSLKMESAPEHNNFHTRPLGDVNTYGTTGWSEGTNTDSLNVDAGNNAMEVRSNNGTAGEEYRAFGPEFALGPNEDFTMSFRLDDATNTDRVGMIVRYFNSAGDQIGADRVFTATGTGDGRKQYAASSPSGTRSCRIIFWGRRDLGGNVVSTYSISKILVTESWNEDGYYDGDSVGDYFWTGAANASASVYHPPQDIGYYESIPVTIGEHNVSAYVWSETQVRDMRIGKAAGVGSADTPTVVGAWTRIDYGYMQGAAQTVSYEIQIKNVPRGEVHYIDSFMLEPELLVDTYFNGSTPNAVGELYSWDGTPHQSSSKLTTYVGANTPPTAETPTADTLISSGANEYSFGMFYTFGNDVGESAASQSTIVKVQRPWSGWAWETADANGAPSGTPTPDPILCADQLVAIMPEAVFDDAMSAGASRWNLYVFTWSNTDSVPVDAILAATKELTPTSTYDEDGWLQVTPAQSDVGTQTAVLPSLANRFNYSNPSRAAQGIVAADRMVLVLDPEAAAVIRWSSNQQGSYTDFTARLGGGYKTLTSGNLMVPACVKLWQNPQSVDTLTILCLGTDGHSTGYYMAPASVQSQADAVPIMGFEETTATPGTVSPYGCEVINNALYHPLDTELMKSTAANYNINHKSQTEQIENMWRGLLTKHRIVSSQHDNRLYLIVNNPAGENLEENCFGNEIWMFDIGKEGGSWSRFLIQAISLRKIEQGGAVHMAVVRPDGIYYLDDLASTDDYVDEDGAVQSRPISWLLETNTQGANRAHDAWCHLQQANIVVGNFQGSMEYGVRGLDINGKPFDKSKIIRDNNAPGDLPFDLEDYFRVEKQCKEWFFYARSIDGEQSAGQLSLVQYRYAPLSVNTGYAYGDVETFEYGRVVADSASQNTVNGTPVPMIDVRRP